MSVFKILIRFIAQGCSFIHFFKRPVHKMKQNDPQIDPMGLTEPDTGLE